MKLKHFVVNYNSVFKKVNYNLAQANMPVGRSYRSTINATGSHRLSMDERYCKQGNKVTKNITYNGNNDISTNPCTLSLYVDVWLKFASLAISEGFKHLRFLLIARGNNGGPAGLC